MLSSPFKKGFSTSFKQNLNPFNPRMLFARFGWNWFVGCYHLPLKKDAFVSSNQTWIPFTHGYVEIVQVVLEKKILKCRQFFFSHFIQWSSLGKVHDPSSEQMWTLFYFCCLAENSPMALEKKIKVWKFHDNNDEQWTIFDQKSSLQPSAQLSYNCLF